MHREGSITQSWSQGKDLSDFNCEGGIFESVSPNVTMQEINLLETRYIVQNLLLDRLDKVVIHVNELNLHSNVSRLLRYHM